MSGAFAALLVGKALILHRLLLVVFEWTTCCAILSRNKQHEL